MSLKEELTKEKPLPKMGGLMPAKSIFKMLAMALAISCFSATLWAAEPGTLKWSYETGGDVSSCPAIGRDGTIYVGSWDDKLYAINPDGSLKWSFLTGYNVYSSPAIGSDGTIYVGSYDSKLYAINPDGSLKWSFLTEDDVLSSPAIGSDGTIYVGSKNDKLYAINGESGGLADTPWSMFHHDLRHTGYINFHAIQAEGDLAPYGNRDGKITVADALVCLRFALGLETPTQEDFLHGDVAPLDASNQPDPDGQITVADALVILRKALGLISF